jgi:hypothetical protein
MIHRAWKHAGDVRARLRRGFGASKVAARVLTHEARFLIAAALLHAAIPALARVAPRPERALVALQSGAAAEIEVDMEEPLRRALAARSAPRADEAAARAPTGERERARERPGRAPAAGEVLLREPQEGPAGAVVDPEAWPVPPPPEGLPPDEYGGPPAPAGTAGVPGLGGVPIWQLPGVLPDRAGPPPAPTAAPPRRETPADRAGQVLREAMQSKDKALGLDLPAAGTVASAVAEAVRASDTPAVARATFEVRLSGAGKVLGARMVSASAGATEAWGRVASAAVARLAGRTLAMTGAFAKGARVYVSVVSSVRMPSGATSGVQMQGAGMAFDLSDIGANATRVVSSSFKVIAVE